MLLDSALYTWGTREDLHLQFSRALMAHGVRPVLVFSEVRDEELADKFRAHGIEVAAINYEKGALQYYWQLRKVIRRDSVTAVYVAFFNYFSLVPWIARLSGLRRIVLHERNGGVLRAKSWKKRLLRLRTRIATRPVTKVIAISQFIKDQLTEVGVPRNKIVMVHHGVDTQRFLPDSAARTKLVHTFSLEPQELILTTVSYLKPIKHPELIVEALAQLKKRGIAARLFVAGDGVMRTELENLSRKMGVAGQIHWLGHVSDPVALLQATDVYLMASVGEAFCLALAEAMGCGSAVVASRSGSLPEIIEDGISGLLVPPLNASALADAIEQLSKNEQLRHQLAINAVKRVREHFTKEASIERMISVYESMWTE